MTVIDAVYRGGTFQPLTPVDLPEGQEVKVNVPTNIKSTPGEYAALLEDLRKHREALFEKYGMFDDSTEIIRADRDRDG